MSKKLSFSILFSLSVLVACNTPTNLDHKDKISSESLKNNFHVSGLIEPSPPNLPILTLPPSDAIDLDQTVVDSTPDNFGYQKQTLNFNLPPSENLDIEKGGIIVIYHNNDKFRVSTTESVKSLNSSYQDQVNNILSKYHIKSTHSFGLYDPLDSKKIICKGKNFKKFHDDDEKDNEDHDNDEEKDNENNHNREKENKCDSKNYFDSEVTNQAISEEQANVSKYFDGEFPDKLSIHIYEFPLNSDTRKISREIRSLSFVRNAYPVLKSSKKTDSDFSSVIKKDKSLEQSNSNFKINSVAAFYPSYSPTYSPSSIPSSNCNLSSTILGYTDSLTTSSNKPSDPGFSSKISDVSTGNEIRDWYWFNKHRIFEGWKVYDKTPMPKIANIDAGFDIDKEALDRPNYVNGFSVKFAGRFLFWDLFNISKDNKVKDDPDESRASHGTITSSIIGSPKDNRQGLCGIAPGAEILPIKVFDLSFSLMEVDRAIEEAAKDPSVDVINLSIGARIGPLTEDPLSSRQIAYAISMNKSVVMAAGNENTYVNNTNRIFGSIIVGNTSNAPNLGGSFVGRQDGGVYISSDSNYGPIVDISASGFNILVPSYYPSDKRRSYDKQSGSSVSAPLVAGACGMIKRLAKANGVNLNPFQIKHIVSYSGTIGYDSFPPKKYIGIDLNDTNHSPYQTPNIRNLNLYNALVIAKNLSNYSVILRQHNTDDYVVSTSNGNWQNYFDFRGYKSDEILGINNLNNYRSQIDFKTYNVFGGYTYGYQLYYGKKYGGYYGEISDYYAGYNFFDKLDGAAGIYGAGNNSNQCCGYLALQSKLIQQNNKSCY